MKAFLTIIFGLTLLAGSAFSMEIEHMSQEKLKNFGSSLVSSSNSAQWQQLSKHMSDAGVLNSSGDQARFTTPIAHTFEIIRKTLGHADIVQAQSSTVAVYIHHFAPEVVGVLHGQNLLSVCVTVDWQRLRQDALVDDVHQIMAASLLMAKPCP